MKDDTGVCDRAAGYVTDPSMSARNDCNDLLDPARRSFNSGPQVTGNLKIGEYNVFNFPVDANPIKIYCTLTWPGSDMGLTLTSPSGQMINPNESPLIRYVKGATSISYEIDNPEAGQWTARVEAIDVPQGGEDYTFATYFDGQLSLQLGTAENTLHYDVGASATILAKLTSGGNPVTGATVTGEVSRNGSKIADVAFYDDGTHGDSQVQDGIYTTTYNFPQPGEYKIEAKASGDTPEKFERSGYIVLFAGDPAPMIYELDPNTRTNDGAASIALTGAGFKQGASVRLTRDGQSDISATDVVVTSTKITCTFDLSGKATGAWDVVVTNPDLQEGSLPGGFTITSTTLAVTSITPSSAGNGSGNKNASVTISGFNFVSGAKVKLTRSGKAVRVARNVTVSSPNIITCNFNLATAAVGAWDVVVTNPDSKTATLPGGFTVNPHPTVTSITPKGAYAGNPGASVSISGANFVSGAVVKLIKRNQSDRIATSVNVSSPTTITCKFDLTTAALGSWKVVVINSDHGTGTMRGSFKVNPLPTVTSITPNSATSGSVCTTKLKGTKFVSGLTVKLTNTGQPAIVATYVRLLYSTGITCKFTIPAGAATGYWDVVVINKDGGVGKLADGFTINP